MGLYKKWLINGSLLAVDMVWSNMKVRLSAAGFCLRCDCGLPIDIKLSLFELRHV